MQARRAPKIQLSHIREKRKGYSDVKTPAAIHMGLPSIFALTYWRRNLELFLQSGLPWFLPSCTLWWVRDKNFFSCGLTDVFVARYDADYTDAINKTCCVFIKQFRRKCIRRHVHTNIDVRSITEVIDHLRKQLNAGLTAERVLIHHILLLSCQRIFESSLMCSGCDLFC